MRGDGNKASDWNGGLCFEWRGASIREIGEDAVETIRASVSKMPKFGWGFEIAHHMHGAVCDIGPDTSPLPRPVNNFCYNFQAWWGDVGQTESALAWVHDSAAALAPYAVPSYINYLSTSDPDGVAAAYGQSFSRLRTLKRRYDPDNLFHRNRNIRPA